MHKRKDPDANLRNLAAEQAGLVSAGQAALLGFGRESVRRMVRQGHWTRISKGVYDTRPGVVEPTKRIWAVTLRALRSTVNGRARVRNRKVLLALIDDLEGIVAERLSRDSARRSQSVPVASMTTPSGHLARGGGAGSADGEVACGSR
jgi:hypothetical protein